MKLYDDPRLAEYLSLLVERLLPEGAATGAERAVRITVIEDATLNAFGLPNGHLYVHSGLLSRLESEAQLAAILAREIAHYVHGDALRLTPRGVKVPMVHVPLGPTAAAIFGLDLRLTAAAISGYRPDQEREADAEAMRRLIASGYDPREATNVFRLLASDEADRGASEVFFYGNRPRMGERYEVTRELLGTTYTRAAEAPTTARSGGEFEQTLRPVVRDNAALDVRAGRFGLAQRQLDRVLAATPRDPIAQLYYGDLYRLRSQRASDALEQTEYVRKALERYERALELDPKYPEPFRHLGFLYFQTKDTAKAGEAFERYLTLAPDAPDAQRIREYLDALRASATPPTR